MKKPKHYFNRTYRQDYLFFIGWKEKDFESYFKKKLGLKIDVSKAGGICTTIQNDKAHGYIIIWLADAKDYPGLGHECNHAAAFTLQKVGVKASFDNDEAFTYLSEDLYSFAIGK